MKKFLKELYKHTKVLHNGKLYYHVTKKFITKYIHIFENVNTYSMIQVGNSKQIYEKSIC